MNRKLLVSLLRKNIEELEMITEGFMEMDEFPTAIVQLARRKTEDIQTIIDELASVKLISTEPVSIIEPKMEHSIEPQPEPAPELVHTPVDEEMIEIVEILEILNEEEEVSHEVIVQPIAQLLPEPLVVQVEVVEQKVAEFVPNLVTETTKTTDITVTEIKTLTEESKKVTIAEKIGHQTTSRNEMLSRGDNSLGATLANKKVSDIKQAISIGDRFRFQRELFKSNGEDMNKTLTYINQLASLNEAMDFLKSKYSWDENNEAVEDFYQIVKRKFA